MKIYYVVFSKNVAISNHPLERKCSQCEWRFSNAPGMCYYSIGILRDPDEYQYFLRLSGGRINEQLELEL